MKDKSFFCMAGLWEKWIKPPMRGEFDFTDLDEPQPSRVIETFTVITTEANPMVARVHERMPVILYKDAWQQWIDEPAQRERREIPAAAVPCRGHGLLPRLAARQQRQK